MPNLAKFGLKIRIEVLEQNKAESAIFRVKLQVESTVQHCLCSFWLLLCSYQSGKCTSSSERSQCDFQIIVTACKHGCLDQNYKKMSRYLDKNVDLSTKCEQMKQKNPENEAESPKIKAESAKIKAESAKIIKWKKLFIKQNWPFLKQNSRISACCIAPVQVMPSI